MDVESVLYIAGQLLILSGNYFMYLEWLAISELYSKCIKLVFKIESQGAQGKLWVCEAGPHVPPSPSIRNSLQIHPFHSQHNATCLV